VALIADSSGGAFFIRPPGSQQDCDAAIDQWPQVIRAVLGLHTPTIACVTADALGAAWSLALACDLRIVAATARVGSPELRWGRLPAAGVMQLLSRYAGPARALQLLLLGEILEGHQLAQIGLALDSAPADQIEQTLEASLDRLRNAAPIALAYVREAVRNGFELPFDDGLRLEADLAALLQTTRDRMAGINAFLKRQPVEFEGR
jgi:enoyl-CoA hydratase/carnithine racemase